MIINVLKPHNGFSKLNCRKYKLKLKTYVLSCSVPNRDLVLKLIRLTRVISVSLGWNLTCLVSWWAILLSLIVRLVKLSFSNPWYFELLEGLKSFFLLKQKFLTTQSLVLKLIQAYLWNSSLNIFKRLSKMKKRFEIIGIPHNIWPITYELYNMGLYRLCIIFNVIRDEIKIGSKRSKEITTNRYGNAISRLKVKWSF